MVVVAEGMASKIAIHAETEKVPNEAQVKRFLPSSFQARTKRGILISKFIRDTGTFEEVLGDQGNPCSSSFIEVKGNDQEIDPKRKNAGSQNDSQNILKFKHDRLSPKTLIRTL